MIRAKRVKRVVPPEPPRDPRLVALAARAAAAGWTATWITESDEAWLRLTLGDARDNASPCVAVFARGLDLGCLASSGTGRGPSVLEALRAAYAQLGVVLDQAEDAFAEQESE